MERIPARARKAGKHWAASKPDCWPAFQTYLHWVAGWKQNVWQRYHLYKHVFEMRWLWDDLVEPFSTWIWSGISKGVSYSTCSIFLVLCTISRQTASRKHSKCSGLCSGNAERPFVDGRQFSLSTLHDSKLQAGYGIGGMANGCCSFFCHPPGSVRDILAVYSGLFPK